MARDALVVEAAEAQIVGMTLAEVLQVVGEQEQCPLHDQQARVWRLWWWLVMG